MVHQILASRSKPEMRQQLLTQRRQQSRTALNTATAAICRHLQQKLLAMTPATLCAYAGSGMEVNLLPWLQTLQQPGWRIGLPVIDPERAGCMRMHRWRSGELLQKNRFGIPEPAADSTPIAAGDIDICLLPLLGFTDRGERLGMGGGYYDRWLPHTRADMLRIGIACDWQRLPALPLDRWDQNMHYVCTESGLHRCSETA